MRAIPEFHPSLQLRAGIARLIASQAMVPASPGSVVDGEPMLCLAGCAAEAGMIIQGDLESAAAFRDAAARTTDKTVLYDAFEKLGWPRDACAAALQFNDSQSPLLRKLRILEALADDT